MTMILMFDRSAGIRFSHSPSGGGLNRAAETSNPAWDFQYLVPRYEVMKQLKLIETIVERRAERVLELVGVIDGPDARPFLVEVHVELERAYLFVQQLIEDSFLGSAGGALAEGAAIDPIGVVGRDAIHGVVGRCARGRSRRGHPVGAHMTGAAMAPLRVGKPGHRENRDQGNYKPHLAIERD